MNPAFLALAALLGFATFVILYMGQQPRKAGASKPAAARKDGSRTHTRLKSPVAKVAADPEVKLAGTWPPKNSTPVTPEPVGFEPIPENPVLEPRTWEKPAGAASKKLDSSAQRIRERYLAARFPGVLKSTADLADTARIIKCARLLFEDGFAARAGELLDLASEAHPLVEATWLANLEIAFLNHDPERYIRLAHAFNRARPESADWPEVKRLGHRLAPMHPRFAGTGERERDFDHSGPWPQMPNWIQANWDFTSEMAAAEMRSRLMAGHTGHPALYRAA